MAPRVWLVGEDDRGVRMLVTKKPVLVTGLRDVETTFRQFGYELAGGTGYALPECRITSSPVTEGMGVIAGGDYAKREELQDAELMVMYLVSAGSVITDERLRRPVNSCLANGTSVSAVQRIVKDLCEVEFGYCRLERLWREALILRDIAFLRDSYAVRREKRLYPFHDLCPATSNPSDNRKLGHLTVAYRNDQGERRHHSIGVYLELTSAGAAQDGRLKAAFDYFDLVRNTIGDDEPMHESFAASFTDRGASLGTEDHLNFERLFEPAHHLHLVLGNVLDGYLATALTRVACKAASFAATAPEFQAYLEQEVAVVDEVASMLWTKASMSRFASAFAVCFVLGSDVGGEPLIKHVVRFCRDREK
jgi:hypothetical protein